MPADDALAEHLIWCAEQALVVWCIYRRDDLRPKIALELHRAHRRVPGDMKTMVAALRASDDAYMAADEVNNGASTYADFAATYAARAVARCVGTTSIDSLREVRLMSALAQAYHAVVLHQKRGGAPAELVTTESETMEAIQATQDNDLRKRMST